MSDTPFDIPLSEHLQNVAHEANEDSDWAVEIGAITLEEWSSVVAAYEEFVHTIRLLLPDEEMFDRTKLLLIATTSAALKEKHDL